MSNRFDDYIQAHEQSATRCRKIIVIILVASLFAFVAYFGVEHNWIRARMEGMENARAYLVFEKDIKDSNDSIRFNHRILTRRYFHEKEFKSIVRESGDGEMIAALHNAIMNYHNGGKDTSVLFTNHTLVKFPHACYGIAADGFTDTLRFEDLDKDSFAKFLLYMPLMHASTRDEFAQKYGYYNRVMSDKINMISLPIVGLSFDVNNLATFTALAFFILFFLLWYSRQRERKNLTLLFETFDGKLKSEISRLELYQLLSMSQVLTVPPSIDEYLDTTKTKSWKDKFFHWFTKSITVIPIAIPAILLFMIMHNDYKTYYIGQALSPLYTTQSMWWALSAGFAMLGMEVLCFNAWRKINGIWKQQAELIKNNPRASKLRYKLKRGNSLQRR